jgi:hypothetical protein
MSYRDRPVPILRLGCLPAVVFGIIVGLPAVFVNFVGECVDEKTGRTGDCPNEGWQFLLILLVVGSLCALITLVTNRLVSLVTQKGHFAAWGVAAGFVLAAALLFTLNYVIIALN